MSHNQGFPGYPGQGGYPNQPNPNMMGQQQPMMQANPGMMGYPQNPQYAQRMGNPQYPNQYPNQMNQERIDIWLLYYTQIGPVGRRSNRTILPNSGVIS